MRENRSLNPLDFYTQQGQISDPGPHAHRFDALPTDLPGMVQVIQGVMLHLHWANRYGVKLTKDRQEEANIRTVSDRLAKIVELQDAPLVQNRSLSKKTVGTCRDFSLLLTAILRHNGTPARARAGFGTYFTPGRFEDHWVCEYWHGASDRWVMVDPQLDALQCEALGIDFDPLDMPREKFVTGGEAWTRCQEKGSDPELFGIFDMHGLDFIKGNVILDFLALNKIELLPWDDFKLIAKSFDEMSAVEKALMDQLAHISNTEPIDFDQLRTVFLTHQDQILPDYN
jgi:hypothetical protein